MDILTQIQLRYATLPQELQQSIAKLSGVSLSVQEAHALSQLSQTGFVGFQNITTPLTPIGLHGELIPFLQSSHDSIEYAQSLYATFRIIDLLIQKIPIDPPPQAAQSTPASGTATTTTAITTTATISSAQAVQDEEDDFDKQLKAAIAEYEKSIEQLHQAEQRAIRTKAHIKDIIQFGTELLTQPLNDGAGVQTTYAMPAAVNVLFPEPPQQHKEDEEDGPNGGNGGLYNKSPANADRELWLKIDEILFNQWDPIGVKDYAPEDEYSSYVPAIYKLVTEAAGVKAISNQLFELSTDNMGLQGNRELCNKVADLLVNLKNKG